jgi:hypothetical protein
VNDLRWVFGLVLGLVFVPGLRAQSFSCPTGTQDMLDYFVMAYPARTTNFMGPGNANPVYSTVVPELGATFPESGYFVWTKSSAGYPWDVKTFDENYIYDRTTELIWTDPTSFKRFTVDLPLSHRCLAPTAGATIKTLSANSNYSSYTNCQSYLTQNLAYVKTTITPPGLVQTDGNLGVVQTRELRYQYGCDSKYGNCSDMEVFSMGFLIGLYEWQHYQNENSTWTLVQESNINEYDSGSVTPYLPCTNSYQ